MTSGRTYRTGEIVRELLRSSDIRQDIQNIQNCKERDCSIESELLCSVHRQGENCNTVHTVQKNTVVAQLWPHYEIVKFLMPNCGTGGRL